MKRTDRLLVQALTRVEIDALLAAPDRSLWRGRRDYALLLTMYNTGARVSEIIALRQEQVQFSGSTLINLMGKGRKERSIPMWSNTAQVLKTWFHELERTRTPIAFPSHRGRHPPSLYGARCTAVEDIELLRRRLEIFERVLALIRHCICDEVDRLLSRIRLKLPVFRARG